MKKNFFIALLGIGSIIGLIFVQVNLLKVGLSLEKERFDQKMRMVLNDVNYHINKHREVQSTLIYFHQTDSTEFKNTDWRKVDQLRDTIEDFLSREISRREIQIGFSYALMEGTEEEIVIASKNFFKEAFEYEKYKRPLAGNLSIECRCRLVLHFHADNLFNYLLRRLAYLIIPSVLFLLLLFGALIFLIYNLNQQRKLAAIKNDFINNLTHEFKTPIFSISLLTKVMAESVKTGNYKKLLEHIELIEKENRQMKEHVNKVLELASLESGRYNLQREEKDAHQLIEEVLEHFLIKLSRKKGHLRKDFAAPKSALNIDIAHLKNVIQNLLENALKYNDKTPEVSVTTSNEDQNFVLDIQDNGIGISTENQKQIFDKFFRVSNGDLHQVKGFGLGLSYVKQIVEAHQGSIQVKSQLGVGTQFKIKLPLI